LISNLRFAIPIFFRLTCAVEAAIIKRAEIPIIALDSSRNREPAILIGAIAALAFVDRIYGALGDALAIYQTMPGHHLIDALMRVTREGFTTIFCAGEAV